MAHRALVLVLGTLIAGVFALVLAQKPFVEYPGQWSGFPLPPDWNEKHEWVFGRLRYNSSGGGGGFPRGGGFRGRGRRASWGTDYPRGDRYLVMGLKRMTRIDARSVEQVVDLDGSDDIYNWPFLYAVEVGHWSLDEKEAAQLRDYLLRGGFLMVDDFHGSYEWEVFIESMRRVFPDRPILDLPDDHQIFHVLHDLNEKFQVPGNQFLYSGRTSEQDGYEAIWRGIVDDKGRVMVAICANMDLGDAIERSDEPEYPEKFSALAHRIVANYAVYSLTH
jgi:hypothetical protein